MSQYVNVFVLSIVDVCTVCSQNLGKYAGKTFVFAYQKHNFFVTTCIYYRIIKIIFLFACFYKISGAC